MTPKVRPSCEDKCLPSKSTYCGFRSVNQPLQKKRSLVAYEGCIQITSLKLHKSGSFLPFDFFKKAWHQHRYAYVLSVCVGNVLAPMLCPLVWYKNHSLSWLREWVLFIKEFQMQNITHRTTFDYLQMRWMRQLTIL